MEMGVEILRNLHSAPYYLVPKSTEYFMKYVNLNWFHVIFLPFLVTNQLHFLFWMKLMLPLTIQTSIVYVLCYKYSLRLSCT